ncbi:pentapeptide repeat-containing protein [Campylobacter lari]|uniref:pentapeptide repeat-containing protein n=1 Tax=Campylobacter lari TaxID=201 RepID=UPI00127E8694|nr:pentapeptide repeat-containing protein [Campylobacter lari]EAK0771276.1 hypothetical protein [Campylobacter lari]EAK6012061.1 hypothetical protein [Campylobacter lari]EAK9997949.1 hypothetical protein [Campylobacter lari]EDP6859827.1 hypothetical protein [Campylobacter lari]MCV3378697.1 pentapeptide repeat-containing protein [Campylobacter lari]
MGSEILTLSKEETENIKDKLVNIIGSSYVNNIKEIDEESVNDFAINDEEYIKKHKNLFIISNKGSILLNLEINLKDLSSLTDDINFQIKFEGYRIAFIDSQSEEKIKIKQNLYFSNCDFKVIELKNICFEKFEIDGYKYGNDHKKSIVFNACEFKELSLKNNTFSESVKFIEKTKIEYLHVELNKFSKYFFIQDCVIGNINLWKNKFENRCYFVDSEFGYERDEDNKAKLNFSNACFKDNAYFNNSKFYNYADFHECEFEKIACFYGVTFDKAPNFSQIILKDNFNALNITLNFTFDDLKKQIKQEYENFNKDTNKQEKKSLDKIANDFRDSFRVVKNALIKDNNLLEASNFHKYELYCKEIELKENWNNRETKTTARKSSLHLKYFIDSLLLGFYRKLSDHHTDFLKVFNNIVLLVALYSVFLFMGGYEDNLKSYQYSDNLLDNNSSLTNAFKDIKNSIIQSSFVQEYPSCILIFYYGLIAIGFLMIFWDILKNIKKIYEVIKNEICIKEIIFCVLNLVAYFLGLLIVLIYLNIYIPKSQDSLAVLSNIGIFFVFIIFYLWLVYLKSLALRLMFVVVSYIIVIIVLGISISILNPFIGKIFNDEQNFTNPIFVYITFAYTILLILILFSLQKTARKNSIVPS